MSEREANKILLMVSRIDEKRPLPSAYWESLDIYDRARSVAIVNTTERKLFVMSRFLLRRALGEFFGVQGEYAQIDTQGELLSKPRLAKENGVEISISHTNHAVAVAISTAGKIGLDLERKQAIDPRSVGVVFSAEELEAFSRLSPEQAADKCIASWAAKEAVAKFLGCPEGMDPTQLPTNSTNLCRLKTWDLDFFSDKYYLCLAHEGNPEILIQKESA